MPLFTFHRNYILRTTKMHAIGFVKDKPTFVPPECVEDAVSIGARPVEGTADNVDDTAEPAVMSADERKAKVFEAFEIMKTRKERLDFTDTGIPNAKRMFPLTGFEVTSNERDTYWEAFRAQEREAQEQAKLDRAG